MPKDETPTPEAATGRRAPRRRGAKRGVVAKLLDLLAESFPRLTKLLKVVRDWTRRKPIWIRVPLYAAVALGALIYGLGERLLKLPGISTAYEELVDYAEDFVLPVASGNAFAIAVTRIEDDDGTVVKSLGVALKIAGVERLQINRRLRFVDADNLDAAEEAAQAKARRWLEKTRSDLLIWGQTIPGEPPMVRLILTVRDAPERSEARVPRRQLAFNFLEKTREPFEAAVQAQVLGFLGQFKPSHPVAEQLRQAVTRLRAIVREREQGRGRSALVMALANAQALLGEQAGDRAMLEEAVTAYRELLAGLSQENAAEWAMVQNNLGGALLSLGRLETGTATWEAAVGAFRAAVAVPGAARVEAAIAQSNLGLALESLARRQPDGGEENLRRAMEAYRAALARLDPQADRADWTVVQNNLGNVLVALGEREPGPARLDEAVGVFRGVLKARDRKQTPLGWAMAQNNLGNALGLLGEREPGTRRLEEAVQAYRAALEEYRPEKLPLDWAMTQRNLGITLRSLGERETGTRRLEESLQALRAAAKAYAEARLPLELALVQNQVGETLRAIGEREKSVARLDEAIGVFEAALEFPELKSAPHYRRALQNNLWKTNAARAAVAEVAGRGARAPAPGAGRGP